MLEQEGLAPVADTVAVPPVAGIPGHVQKHLLKGTSALGLAILTERGLGFLANILAARLGGASTFGTYSLAITTANNISTYAAGQIGATATRFSGKYPHGTKGYSTLAKALAIVSLVSACLAVIALWLGAAPIAHLLGKTSITGLLRWAAISAAGMLLLECARGFFVGQRRLMALLLLSLLVGLGMIVLLPLAARMHSPVRMIVSQGCIAMAAVLLCLLLAKPLLLHNAAGAGTAPPLGPMLREIWSFGFVQLAGLVGSNLAGWWLMTLVARADTTLVQMSFFAIASQLRNIIGLGPGLLTEGSYAFMADPDDKASKTPQNVMALCTYMSTMVSLVLASAAMILVPWGLTLLYGRTYAAAGATTAMAMAVAVVHMGNAPAAARLSIVSIRATGVINTAWAIFVAALAFLFLLHGGNAWQAMGIYLAAHLLSAALVLGVLGAKDHVPGGMVTVFLLASSTSIVLAGLAYMRAQQAAHTGGITAVMVAVLVASLGALALLGSRHGWLPSKAAVDRMVLAARGFLQRRAAR